MSKKVWDIKKDQRFDMIVFNGKMEKRKQGTYGEFTCDDGIVFWARMTDVVNGKTRSCGCQAPNRNGRENKKKYGNDYGYYIIWQSARIAAETREIPFLIEVDDIKNLYLSQHGKCYYSKEQLTIPNVFSERVDDDSVSVDRTDSKKPYEISNIKLVKKWVNALKFDLSYEEFITNCVNITSRNSNAN